MAAVQTLRWATPCPQAIHYITVALLLPAEYRATQQAEGMNSLQQQPTECVPRNVGVIPAMPCSWFRTFMVDPSDRTRFHWELPRLHVRWPHRGSEYATLNPGERNNRCHIVLLFYICARIRGTRDGAGRLLHRARQQSLVRSAAQDGLCIRNSTHKRYTRWYMQASSHCAESGGQGSSQNGHVVGKLDAAAWGVRGYEPCSHMCTHHRLHVVQNADVVWVQGSLAKGLDVSARVDAFMELDGGHVLQRTQERQATADQNSRAS